QRNPIIGSLITIAASAICGPCGALAQAVITGITTGKLGLALKAGFIAIATQLAFGEIGDLTGHRPAFLSGDYFANVLAHALTGCAQSAASGGSCGPGALSGALTSAAAPFINSGGFVPGLVANATLGGVASVIGHGKFENGAITGAFGYLFNAVG